MLCEVVERYNAHSHTRHDLFGFIDIVAVSKCAWIGYNGIWAVQCTTVANMAARCDKITTECRQAARLWLASGGYILVFGWAKRGPRGARKVWTYNRRMITLEDLRDDAT